MRDLARLPGLLPLLLAVAGCAGLSPGGASASADVDWPSYGGSVRGARHSPLAEIDTGTVKGLALAWTYHTGELGPEFRTRNRRSLEVTPIVVDGTMYLITPLARIIALDPATGRERWRYDARLDGAGFGNGLPGSTFRVSR